MKKRGIKRLLKKMKSDAKHKGICGGGVYFLGFIGALVYNIQNATSFWYGVLGVVKAIAWPAFLVYKLLNHQN